MKTFKYEPTYMFTSAAGIALVLGFLLWNITVWRVFILILILAYVARMAFRIDLTDDKLVVYRIFGKKDIPLESIHSVSKGYCYDKISYKSDYILIDHLIPNISQLLAEIKLKQKNVEVEDGLESVTQAHKKPVQFAFRVIFFILLSVVGVFFFISFVIQNFKGM